MNSKQKIKYSVALGTFDGIHIGHFAVLRQACSLNGLIPIAVTFNKPPKCSIDPDTRLIITKKKKKELLNKIGVNDIFFLDFEKIKNLGPIEFLDFISEKFCVSAFVCGFNYTFGKNREGTPEMLKNYCKQLQIPCFICEPVNYENHIVSSSHIRSLISNGNIKIANQLLFSPFSFESPVIHGQQRGRTLGFPTINQIIDPCLITPKFGVYFSVVKVDKKKYNAITNIGIRPTFPSNRVIAETHIPNFNLDMYGKYVEVSLLDYLRPELKFNSEKDLKQAIEDDIAKIPLTPKS